MPYKFYDKVAKKFGSYQGKEKYITEYPDQDPEEVFKLKLLELSGKEKTALDVGCADGRFTLSISPNFKSIIAIDLSEGMLTSARNLQRKKKVKNVSFEKQDAFHTSYGNLSFNVIYSRRGPTPVSEAFRLLEPEGHFIEIDIGEKDCQEIKEVFGRGQDYGQWNTPRLDQASQNLIEVGFVVEYAKDFHCTEYYDSYGDLDLFLQGVPIFEDFDSQKDKRLLEEYVTGFKAEKGIKLPRHRVVIVSKKPS